MVFIWLQLIDDRLPLYVSRISAHDLQSKSLEDIQPQICHSLDSLLAELNAQEECQINYSKSKFTKRKGKSVSFYKHDMRNSLHNSNSHSKTQKSCVLCKTAGRTYEGHSIGSYWFYQSLTRWKLPILCRLVLTIRRIQIMTYSKVMILKLFHVYPL